MIVCNSSILNTFRSEVFAVSLRWLTLVLLLLLVVSSGFADDLTPAVGTSFLTFYSPETNINNYGLLKGEFDSYFAGRGNFEFQPFSDSSNFDTFVKKKMNCALMIYSRYYQRIGEKIDIKSFLVGTRGRKSTQKLVLCAENSIQSISMLKGERVAIVASREYTTKLLIEILGQQQISLIESLEFLVVPNEIDALMAVGFGVVRGALTSDYNLANLAEISPKDHKLLNRLATSNDILLPLIAARIPNNANTEKLINIIEDMGNNLEGRRRLNMMNLDRFQKLSDADMQILARSTSRGTDQ